MKLFGNMNISASALSMNRLRMDVISSNIANANTTRAEFVDGKWQPYKRKMVEVAPKDYTSFDNFLEAAMNKGNSQSSEGVKATRIVEDKSDFKRVYDPQNPDADKEGYVYMPNVDMLKEMVDLMETTRSYEANVTAYNAGKMMMTKALELGKG